MPDENQIAPDGAPRRKKWEPPVLAPEELAALDEKHDDVFVCEGDPEMSPWKVVLRRPTRPETLLYKSNSRRTEGNQSVIANEVLVRATAVWPAQHHLDAMFNRFPMMGDAIVNNERWRAFIGVAAEMGLKG